MSAPVNHDRDAVPVAPVEVTPEGVVVCGWFALCQNPATGVVEHWKLGYVPVCPECAHALGLEVIPATWVVES